MNTKLKSLAIGLILLGLLSACSSTYKNTQTARTAIEQLLLSEAVTTSLSQRTDMPLPIPQGAKVVIDTTGVSSDQVIVRHAMSRWLGEHGYLIQDDKENATYRVNVIVESLGTEYGDTFVGIPPIGGGLLPISTPELAFYKAQYQTGYVKFHFDMFELPSGRFAGSTSPFLAEKYYNDYTVLFLFTFKKTDLMAPPQLGTIGRKSRTISDENNDGK